MRHSDISLIVSSVTSFLWMLYHRRFKFVLLVIVAEFIVNYCYMMLIMVYYIQ